LIRNTEVIVRPSEQKIPEKESEGEEEDGSRLGKYIRILKG